MVIWVTGLSGSGKSTLCNALYAALKPSLPHLVKLDGDEIRAAFGNDLGHAEADRVRQINRIQGMAKVLGEQGLIVLVAALYANPDLLAWNRANLPGYFEVYVKADLDLLQSRDGKGLYRGAKSGNIRNVVGVDIPWREPIGSHLVIDASDAPPPEVLAANVATAIPQLQLAMQRAAQS